MAKITLRDKATGKNYTVEWTSKTPPTAKESAALIAAAKAKANAPKTTPETNPFLRAIQPPQPPKPRAKPANPLKTEIQKATKPVPKPQRQPTVVERKIAGTQSVTAKYGNSMADDRASTVESEMASYDLKNFGKVTRGDRSLAPSNITDSEWKARNEHRAKVIGIKPRKDANTAVAKQLAYGQETGTPGIGLTKEELQSVRDTTPRFDPVSAAIVDTATRPGILGLFGGNKDSVTQVNDLIYGLSQDPGRADSNPLVDSLFSATPDVFGGDLSGTYLRAVNSGKSYNEIDPKQRAAQQVGNFLASILGGSIVGKGVSGVSKPAQMATGFALTDLPGYAKMVADSQGNLGSAAGNFVGSIGNSVQNADKLFDPNTPIDEKTNIALGLVTAGFLSAGAFHGLAKAGVVNDVPIPDATAKPPQISPEVPLTNAEPAPQMPDANARLQPSNSVDSGISDGNTSNARYAGDARGWARRPNEPKAKPISNDNVGTPKPTSKGVRSSAGNPVNAPNAEPVKAKVKPPVEKPPIEKPPIAKPPIEKPPLVKGESGPIGKAVSDPNATINSIKPGEIVFKPESKGSGADNLADVTGPARQFGDRDMKNRGNAPSPKTAKGKKEIYKEAIKQYREDPARAIKIINDALETRNVPSDEDFAVVTVYHRNVVNNYNRAFEENNFADARKYSDEQDRVEELFQMKRTQFAQGGQALQIAMKPDFSAASLMRKAKVMNAGMDVGEEVRSKIQEYTKLYSDAQRELEEATKKIEWLEKQLEEKKSRAKTQRKSSEAYVQNAKRRRELALNRLRKLGFDTIDTSTKEVGVGMKSKRSGSVNIPKIGDDNWMKAKREVRTVAATHITEGTATDIDSVIKAVMNDMNNSVSYEDVLSMLSDRYRSALIDTNVAKMKTRRLMHDIKREADYRLMNGFPRFMSKTYDVVATQSRSLKAGLDLSFALVQGGKMALSLDYWKSWAPVYRALTAPMGKVQDTIDRLNAEIEAHPRYEMAVQAGLGVTSLDGSYNVQEELVAGNVIRNLSKHIKGFNPQLFLRAEGAYQLFLKKLRFERFLSGISTLGSNPDPRKIRDVARTINVLTGRGDGHWAQLLGGKEAGTILFAPRYMYSEWQSAGFYDVVAAKTAFGRQYALKEHGRQLALMGIIYGLALACGCDIERDIKSQEFGVIRITKGPFKGKQLDFFSKWLQPYRLIGQLFYGRVSVRGKYQSPTAAFGKVGGEYLTNKLAPIPRFVAGLAQGFPDFDNEKPDGTIPKQEPGDTALDLVVPMAWKSAIVEMRKGNPLGWISLLGVNSTAVRRESQNRPRRYRGEIKTGINGVNIPQYRLPPNMEGTYKKIEDAFKKKFQQ